MLQRVGGRFGVVHRALVQNAQRQMHSVLSRLNCSWLMDSAPGPLCDITHRPVDCMIMWKGEALQMPFWYPQRGAAYECPLAEIPQSSSRGAVAAARSLYSVPASMHVRRT